MAKSVSKSKSLKPSVVNFFNPEEFVDTVLFVVRVPLFLAPFQDLVKRPADAEYSVEDGVATLTLTYKPVKYLAPRPELLDELVSELQKLPADISVNKGEDTVTVTLKDVDKINEGYTITITVKVLVDYTDQSATVEHYISFAYKVI